MKKMLAIAMFGGFALAASNAYAQADPSGESGSAPARETASAALPALPAVPGGKSTILGGQIRDVDPVRDKFTLHIYGERPLSILYDERTQLFHDGVKVPLRQLGPEDRASIQTVLDGSQVFAISIHILSHSPEGECEGRVVSYDPQTSLLAISSAISPEPVRLQVPASTVIIRAGEPEFTAVRSGLPDLVAGTLVTATFAPDAQGRDVASRITVLAVPGARFAFSGNITFLDLSTGSLALVDPRDGKGYQIRMSSASTASQKLHRGESISVTAIYDGTNYLATQITTNN